MELAGRDLAVAFLCRHSFGFDFRKEKDGKNRTGMGAACLFDLSLFSIILERYEVGWRLGQAVFRSDVFLHTTDVYDRIGDCMSV